jgi:hypothetical protein
MAADWRKGDPDYRVYIDNSNLMRKFREEEWMALTGDGFKHVEKIAEPFTNWWVAEGYETGKFDFRAPMTEAEIRDLACDWAFKLKNLLEKMRITCYVSGFGGCTELFVCEECEDSSGFQSSDALVTFGHIVEEHPPPPLAKSAKKC